MILVTMETAETSHDKKTAEDVKGGQLRGDVSAVDQQTANHTQSASTT